MKWRPKADKPKHSRPSKGDKRIIKRFAWYPKKTQDNFYVWLEKYEVVQYWGWNYNIVYTRKGCWRDSYCLSLTGVV